MFFVFLLLLLLIAVAVDVVLVVVLVLGVLLVVPLFFLLLLLLLLLLLWLLLVASSLRLLQLTWNHVSLARPGRSAVSQAVRCTPDWSICYSANGAPAASAPPMHTDTRPPVLPPEN